MVISPTGLEPRMCMPARTNSNLSDQRRIVDLIFLHEQLTACFFNIVICVSAYKRAHRPLVCSRVSEERSRLETSSRHNVCACVRARASDFLCFSFPLN
jgi:hypothetical protein